MKERLYGLLNLKASETNFVFDLLSIQLFIGIANSFINIVSLTLFIHHFPASNLAWAYLAVAIILIFLNFGYEKLEKKLSPLLLLRWIIVSSAAVLFAFWAGLLTLDKGVMIFLLLVLATLFYMVTGYAYWGLVSLLFNVRESRRLFSIVGSGDIPAKLIGYSLTPLLVPLIGLENLLGFSIAALAVGFVLLNKLILKKRWERILHHVHTHHPGHAGAEKPASVFRFLLGHKLILTISLLSLVSYNVYNFIDFTFITQIKARVQDLSTLSTYIAVFFAVGRLVAFGLKLIFTSRVIERLGVISCLLLTPVVLVILSILLILFGNAGNTLYIFGLMAMVTEVLRSAMQEPVFFILFQPLSEHNRLRGHIIAKGYMLAPSLLLVGATLLLFQYIGYALTINHTVQILMVNLLVWAGVIYYIRRAFFHTLHQSIAKGVFSGDILKIADTATIEILLRKIEEGSVTEKIYALKLLHTSGYKNIHHLLRQEMVDGETETKKFVLQLWKKEPPADPAFLQERIAAENDDEVKEQLMLMLCQQHPEYLATLSGNLSSLSYRLRKHLIILLMDHTEFDSLHRAGTEINALLTSSLGQERELALEIISELKNIKFTEAIRRLLHDGDNAVKRNAILAVCKLQNESMLPLLFERLQNGAEKFMVIQGLFQYGDRLFEDIKNLPADNITGSKAELVKIAAKVKGPNSVQFLIGCLHEKTALQEKIIHVLWTKAFKAQISGDITFFQTLLKTYLAHGIKKIGYHTAVPVFPQSQLVKQSIGSEIWYDLTTTLQLASILYARKEIDRVIELVESRDHHKLINAMEMLELVLPKKTARQVNDLLEYLLEQGPLRKAQNPTATEGFLQDVMLPGSVFNQWTKAVSLYTSLAVTKPEIIQTLPLASEPYESIVLKETREYVLTRLQPIVYADH